MILKPGSAAVAEVTISRNSELDLTAFGSRARDFRCVREALLF